MPIIKRLLRYALILALAGTLLGAIAIGVAYWLISPRLPSVDSLKDVQMQVPLRVLSADGKLIAEFGEMRRLPVKIDNVPARLKHAVLAAEDDDFYHHGGVDWTGTLRAAIHVVLSGGKKTQGGSTITQQVARNFFLSSQKTYTRKITEIFTAFRIEHELTKDEILQLYLNKMFLGHRTYGVGAAAQYYYGKTLDQLTIAECAMIASTFQRPSVVNPTDHQRLGHARRDYVLGRMLANNFITKAQYEEALATPLHAAPHELPIAAHAPYLAEMVRQAALDKLGNAALTDGYVIHTTIRAQDQADAVAAVRKGLLEYDRRHGYRGPEAHVQLPPQAQASDYAKILAHYHDVGGLKPALVVTSGNDDARLVLDDGRNVQLKLDAVAWAQKYLKPRYRGPKPKHVDDVLKPGDIVRLRKDDKGQWQLAQIPAAQSGLVSLNPDDGAVLALVGGFSFQRSKFNRALMTGSGRQPGSSFKPFIYSAAFEHGFTPATIINDAPVVLPDPSKPNGQWTPSNDDGKFDGPIRLRTALIKSKNLVSVRLLDTLGLQFARQYALRFGFDPDAVPDNLSMALGTASVSPMTMARAYAVFANGGFLVEPYFIQEIDNRDGQTIYKANPLRACRDCQARLLQSSDASDTLPPAPSSSVAAAASYAGTDGLLPLQPIASSSSPQPAEASSTAEPRLAPRVINIRNDYLTTSLMKDVILHGTGIAARALNRPDLAGKTGTTNEHRDAWFCGFNDKVVTTVWVGFDNFSTLGYEFGATAALPIWMDYMGAALKGTPESALPRPPGITSLLINRNTGLPTTADDPDAMPEIFKVEDVPHLQELARKAKQDQNQKHAYDIF
ncbi:penicillin-binding protein 1A [Oleiagrimonas soli]|uniref:Penicillin-binding protein 1A n=1 Tax=Oleiagrimonas soli TaxID=1543381 RepID=A0A099CT87_9GAMM|nr:penicillin-binding protein 1A [Oleiagrimonas soli]KGI76842.1 penicillin-binding protein [Oleiagrimonas soli]MBB6185307.1 penicillin-binding protein 1A [Oleiagrimonas soli]